MLTKKEIEILKLKKKGLTQIEIASVLKISQPAVSLFYTKAKRKVKDAKEVLSTMKELGVEVE